jgi:hypothetical protein
MDDIPLTFAKDHLEDLIARARRGEVVTINDGYGPVRLTANRPFDVTAPRVTDTMPPFVPLSAPRVFGSLEGQIPLPPDEFFAPMSESELKDWYGEEA